MRHRGRRLVALLAGLALALAAAAVVAGATGSPTDKVLTGADVVIPAESTVDHDLYAFGGTVTVAGTVHGDLVAAAARVLIDGTVTGDLLVAASEVQIRERSAVTSGWLPPKRLSRATWPRMSPSPEAR